MELLFIALAGVIIGLAGRYLLPWRATHGAALLPAIGGIAAMVLWVALLGTGAVVAIVDLTVGRLRMRSDAALVEQISQHGLPSAG